MLQQKINEDLKSFLKAGKNFEAGVLRLMIASLRNKEIDKRALKQGKGGSGELVDEEIIEVLRKEAKKRKEAVEIYEKGGRQDLVEKEKSELAIIKNYLPAEMAREEIEKVVDAAIKNVGAISVKDFNKVIAEAMKELKARKDFGADAGTVSELIKEKLNHLE